MMNPMQLMQMMRSGNPQNVIQQLMGNQQIMGNPMFKNAMDMYQKGDNAGLQKLAENICQGRGTTVDEVRRRLGL